MAGSATAENPRVIPDAMVSKLAAALTASCWKNAAHSTLQCFVMRTRKGNAQAGYSGGGGGLNFVIKFGCGARPATWPVGTERKAAGA